MWDDVRWFVAAVESGSFSDAAKRGGVSVATVSRRVESLERRLGVRLLDRQVYGISPTSEGQIIFESASSAADKISEIERIAESLKDDVVMEPVVISSTEPVVSEVLAPNLAEFLRLNPNIKLRMSVSTDNVSLFQRGADIAIRLARPVQDNLVIKPLPRIDLGLFCSQYYLNGREPTALDLSQEVLLGMDRSFGEIQESTWFMKQGLGRLQVLESSSVRTLCNAAKAGCGIALIPQFIGRREQLEEIPQPQLPSRAPYIVYHRDLRNVKRMRVVRKWIEESFRILP